RSLLCCLSSSRPPRPVPSFPTRRSSDLVGPNCRAGRDAVLLLLQRRADGRLSGVRGGVLRPANDHMLHNQGKLQPSHDPDAGGPDRKSTRLNSSHVKISYAVFCLKKKKK